MRLVYWIYLAMACLFVYMWICNVFYVRAKLRYLPEGIEGEDTSVRLYIHLAEASRTVIITGTMIYVGIVMFITGFQADESAVPCENFLNYRLPSLGVTLYLLCRLFFAFSRVILFKSTVMQASARKEIFLVAFFVIFTLALEVADQMSVYAVNIRGTCLASRPKWVEYATVVNVACLEVTSFCLFYIPMREADKVAREYRMIMQYDHFQKVNLDDGKSDAEYHGMALREPTPTPSHASMTWKEEYFLDPTTRGLPDDAEGSQSGTNGVADVETFELLKAFHQSVRRNFWVGLITIFFSVASIALFPYVDEKPGFWKSGCGYVAEVLVLGIVYVCLTMSESNWHQAFLPPCCFDYKWDAWCQSCLNRNLAQPDPQAGTNLSPSRRTATLSRSMHYPGLGGRSVSGYTRLGGGPDDRSARSAPSLRNAMPTDRLLNRNTAESSQVVQRSFGGSLQKNSGGGTWHPDKNLMPPTSDPTTTSSGGGRPAGGSASCPSRSPVVGSAPAPGKMLDIPAFKLRAQRESAEQEAGMSREPSLNELNAMSPRVTVSTQRKTVSTRRSRPPIPANLRSTSRNKSFASTMLRTSRAIQWGRENSSAMSQAASQMLPVTRPRQEITDTLTEPLAEWRAKPLPDGLRPNRRGTDYKRSKTGPPEARRISNTESESLGGGFDLDVDGSSQLVFSFKTSDGKLVEQKDAIPLKRPSQPPLSGLASEDPG